MIMRFILWLGVFIMAISTNASFSGTMGPLKVSKENPRYFADRDGNVVYLTGSHTWSNFKDMGKINPPSPFDYESYLDFLQKYNHNFIRLWTWDLTKYSYDGTFTYAEPFPWQRTGTENALDGKPKFDLSKFNESYFERLRSRVIDAGKRNIYVSIMLFEGHGLHSSQAPWCWDGHPFNASNNVNGINGDPNGDGKGLETQTLQIPEITRIQDAYVRKVIDTVNDLDNVLYEIVNESGAYSTEWQYHIINFIHEYEKSKKHPVGMTFQYAPGDMRGTNANLFNSPADWISPNPEGGYTDNPPPADGSKVILSDTDHLWGIGGDQVWVWKSFCRGLNPLFMDHYFDPKMDHYLDPKLDPIRKNLGYTLSYAKRMNLAKAIPKGDLVSTGYCLANPDVEYLVYLPDGGEATVDLSGASGNMDVEWFNPSKGVVASKETITGGTKQFMKCPFDGDAVLCIKK
jgi:hypothetical protein